MPNRLLVLMVMTELVVARLIIIIITIRFETPIMLGISVFFTSALVTFRYVWGRSTWFGVIVWLIYLRALLVMFLFFVSLAPNPSFSLGGSWITKVSILMLTSFITLAIISGVINRRFEWEGACLPIVVMWSEGGRVLIAGLVSYLFFAVVIISKLGGRGGGALRGIH